MEDEKNKDGVHRIFDEVINERRLAWRTSSTRTSPSCILRRRSRTGRRRDQARLRCTSRPVQRLRPTSLRYDPPPASGASLAPMVAAMSTLVGPVSALEEVSRLASESVGPWLREYEGYRGTFVFVDAGAGKARLMTLWESAADELRARASRGAMRDQLAATAGMSVVEFEVLDILAWEVVEEG